LPGIGLFFLWVAIGGLALGSVGFVIPGNYRFLVFSFVLLIMITQSTQWVAAQKAFSGNLLALFQSRVSSGIGYGTGSRSFTS
jgi:hypothetical protein